MAKKWIFRSTPPISARALAEVDLSMSGSWLSGTNTPLPQPTLVHIILHDRQPAGVAVLVRSRSKIRFEVCRCFA